MSSTHLHAQLQTLSYTHLVHSAFPLARVAEWLRGAAAVGVPLPLGLAHDVGGLLLLRGQDWRIEEASSEAGREWSSAYVAFLQRVAASPLVRELSRWPLALSDAMVALILARLVEGVAAPEGYRVPTGVAGVDFVHRLRAMLAQTEPKASSNASSNASSSASDATDTPLAPLERGVRANSAEAAWAACCSAEVLARIEANLAALSREELRILAHYGPPMAGTPDARDLLDGLALLNLPPMVRLALSQSLRLLPRLSETRLTGGVQRYPAGGYEGLSRQGSLDSLLASELVYEEDLFLHRILNHEALYYGRERPPMQQRAVAYIVVQCGAGLGADGQLLARALLLALGSLLHERQYDVYYSFAGTRLSQPAAFSRRGEISRILYYKEKDQEQRFDPSDSTNRKILQTILQQLKQWQSSYQTRHLLWVGSEHFDADGIAQHAALYHALQAQAHLTAWYIGHPSPTPRPPATAAYFSAWQRLDSNEIWQQLPTSPPPAQGEFAVRRALSLSKGSNQPAWMRFKQQIERYPFREGVRDVLHFTHDAQREAWQELARLDPSALVPEPVEGRSAQGGPSGYRACRDTGHREQPEVDAYLRTLAPPDMAYIPAGMFIMGSADDDPDASNDEKPQHEVWLHGYYMNRYPITNAQYGAFMEAGGYKQADYWREAAALGRWEEGKYRDWDNDWVSEPEYWHNTDRNQPQQPVVGISWHEALAYCRWAGMDLPTEAQWEKAAGWDADEKRMRRYPWGDEYDESKVQPIRHKHSEVGQFCDGKLNYYGLSDMTGLYHWCRSRYLPYPSTPRQARRTAGSGTPYQPDKEREGLEGEDYRVIRGYWDYRLNFLRCRSRNRNNPDLNGDYYGGAFVPSGPTHWSCLSDF